MDQEVENLSKGDRHHHPGVVVIANLELHIADSGYALRWHQQFAKVVRGSFPRARDTQRDSSKQVEKRGEHSFDLSSE
jgi:hypothetical protein